MIERDAGAMVTRFLISHIEGWIYVHYVVKEGDACALSSLADAFPDRNVGPFSHEIRPNVGIAVASLDEAERRRLAGEKLPRNLGLPYEKVSGFTLVLHMNGR